MPETTVSKLRSHLKEYCDRAVEDREPIRVRRRNGEDVVLLAAEEFDGLAETVHLLSSPRNAARLLAALKEARQGKGKPLSLEEFRASVGL